MSGNQTRNTKTTARAVRAERIKDVVLPLVQHRGAIQAISGMQVVLTAGTSSAFDHIEPRG